jgi:uncharacterized membrane protein
MRVTSASWISAFLAAATAGVALWAWLALPAGVGVPVNYLGLDGQHHLGSSRLAVWLIPAVAGVVLTAMVLAPRLTRRPADDAAPELYAMTPIAVTGLLLVTEAALVQRALDASYNVMRPVAVTAGVLLLAIGNYLGKSRQNSIVGLKTPWTLADPRVWDKTQRFTGRGMVVGGLALVALGLLLHDGTALGLAIGACAAIPTLAGVLKSRALYRRA